MPTQTVMKIFVKILCEVCACSLVAKRIVKNIAEGKNASRFERL